MRWILIIATCCWFAIPSVTAAEGDVRVFAVKGVVREIKAGDKSVAIQHEAIPGYMAAMTMSFPVQDASELAGLKSGDPVSFQLHVTAETSWIAQIRKSAPATYQAPYDYQPGPPLRPVELMRVGLTLPDPLLTNQLGREVSLGQFKGQALALTFFFTRCPLPQFCPQLSKNFHDAAAQLTADRSGPTNWHFLSITFDPVHDTPAALQEYGERYQADAQHWSFLTGAPEVLESLARQFGVTTTPEGETLNHNFRTVIVNPDGRIRAIWPIVGNMSSNIAVEIAKAARGEGLVPGPLLRP